LVPNAGKAVKAVYLVVDRVGSSRNDRLKTKIERTDIETIEETLKAHIGKELISGEKTDLDLDTDLIGLVDSTGVMELTVWIESTFGFSVEIDDITPENFGTIRRLADWIRRNSTQAAE